MQTRRTKRMWRILVGTAGMAIAIAAAIPLLKYQFRQVRKEHLNSVVHDLYEQAKTGYFQSPIQDVTISPQARADLNALQRKYGRLRSFYPPVVQFDPPSGNWLDLDSRYWHSLI